MAATTCEAVSTYALGLLHWYTQPCETDRSQCSGGDFSYDTCQCEANSFDQSAATFCRDGCIYSFGDNYSVIRDFSVTVTENSLGTLATSSLTHLIGFTNVLFKGTDFLGKISLDFAPDVLGGRQNEPSLGGPFYAWWNDQECDIQQIWCDDAQTSYNFYIDCSFVSGDYGIVNMCDASPLTDQSTILELALLGPLYACWLPSYLPVTFGDSTSLPNGGLGGDPIPEGVTGGGVGGAPVFGSGGGGDPTGGAPLFGTGDTPAGIDSSPIGTGATATAGALPTGGGSFGSFSDATLETSSATIAAIPSSLVTFVSVMMILCLRR